MSLQLWWRAIYTKWDFIDPCSAYGQPNTKIINYSNLQGKHMLNAFYFKTFHITNEHLFNTWKRSFKEWEIVFLWVANSQIGSRLPLEHILLMP